MRLFEKNLIILIRIAYTTTKPLNKYYFGAFIWVFKGKIYMERKLKKESLVFKTVLLLGVTDEYLLYIPWLFTSKIFQSYSLNWIFIIM